MNKLFILSVLILFVFGVIGIFSLVNVSALSENHISVCQIISGSGNYILTQDIDSNGTCFIVDADNVVIDGNGYSAFGNGSGSGISVQDSLNLTIKNIKFDGFFYGLNFSNVKNSLVENSEFSNNLNKGISLLESDGNLFKNDSVESNGDTGVYFGYSVGNSYIGGDIENSNSSNVDLDKLSNNSVFDSVVFSNPGEYGFVIDENVIGTRLIDTPSISSYHFGESGGVDFEDSSYGKVNFTSSLWVKGSSSGLKVGNNSVYVSSDFSKSPISGIVTLYGISKSENGSKNVIMRDGKICGASICNNLTNLSGNVTFEITEPGTYSIQSIESNNNSSDVLNVSQQNVHDIKSNSSLISFNVLSSNPVLSCGAFVSSGNLTLPEYLNQSSIKNGTNSILIFGLNSSTEYESYVHCKDSEGDSANSSVLIWKTTNSSVENNSSKNNGGGSTGSGSSGGGGSSGNGNFIGGGSIPPGYTYFKGRSFIISQKQFDEGAVRNLSVGDRFEFEFNNNTNYVYLNSVSENGTLVSVEDKNYTISSNGLKRFDLDSDGFYDLYVSSSYLNGSSAEMKIGLIHELIYYNYNATYGNLSKSETNLTSEPKKNSSIGITGQATNTEAVGSDLIVGAIVVGLILFVVALFVWKNWNLRKTYRNDD